ncbi:MAG: type II 3-dehydroquinate dehydratase [Saprospiraceae bacterium]
MNAVVHIINGPNLNLIGIREPEIYGSESYDSYFKNLKVEFLQFDIQIFQSNHEGELVDYIQSIIDNGSGIIINPAAFTHTSIALRDALLIHKCPIIEIHLSNLQDRENFRHESYIKDLAWSFIQGMGLEGYRVALLRMKEFLIPM